VTRAPVWGGEIVLDDLTVRPMTRAGLDILMEWAAREGWNPGLNDARIQ
jgi:hypothetical protein